MGMSETRCSIRPRLHLKTPTTPRARREGTRYELLSQVRNKMTRLTLLTHAQSIQDASAALASLS